MPHTEGTEYGSLLPTPNTCDANNANNKDNHDVDRGYLRGYATMGLLPTPTASAIGENQSNHQLHISKDGVAKPIRESGMKGNSNLYATLQVRGMLPTPNARDFKAGQSQEKYEARKELWKDKGVNLQMNLPQALINGLLPTPTAMDSTNATATMKSTQVKEGSMHSVTLTRAMSMGMLPTPQAQEGEKITGNENQDSMTKRVRQMTGTTSQLNPRFVAEMMGFPPNWTELPFQSGEMNP
jgi:hypothetical protein